MKGTFIYIFLVSIFFVPMVVFAQEAPLSESQVRNYIKTEIQVGLLQKKMKANADRYENLIQTFYKRKKVLLERRGWTEPLYDEVQNRIMEAANAIRQFNTNKQEGSVSADQPDYDETISLIQSNTYLPEEKKKKLIERLKKMQKEHVFQKLKTQVRLQREELYKRSRADWPAVKPYLKKLEQLTNWYNGNGAAPPEIE